MIGAFALPAQQGFEQILRRMARRLGCNSRTATRTIPFESVLLLALLLALAAQAKPERAGVFVVGVDGMDPVILERLLARGEMPNFARLRDEGSLQTLGTATPPQSPVAWSNFVTGMNPGG